MLSEKAWQDGLARLNACFPAAQKNLTPKDIAVRDLAYHDAIAPLFGSEDERKDRPHLMREEAWPAAIVEVTRTWEYPFALPPPQELIEAARGCDARLAGYPGRRTPEEIEAGKRAAAKGLALIQAEMAKRGAPAALPVRSMRALPPASGEDYLVSVTDERLQELRELAAKVVSATNEP